MSGFKYCNTWITNRKMKFFENGKYWAVKLTSETLCNAKCFNHRIFVSFAVRRDSQGPSELET